MPFHLRVATIAAAAIIAAAVHHRYLADQIEQRPFVGTQRATKLGGRLKPQDLTPIWLGGDLASLSRVLLPWDERSMALGNAVLRDYGAGELIVRRDVEATVTTPYVPRRQEYVFVVEMPNSLGLKNAFQIGSAVGFLLEVKRGPDNAAEIQECGPFVIRQFGAVSRQVDQRLMQQLPTTSVTLSLPAAPHGQRPARAQELLNALSGHEQIHVIGLYHPTNG